ncbi:hypothetical protein BJF83_16295 [Nocardiopsis sp. CNR-923]|uniref:hypothetical protein n=1 Tax=Nocardiopsis sp. CNR-923 TaxID=1904965 RepID=UPI000962C082|nr:hypothetical protein [Nocardiopsis sp. CNR-923]OLT27997.1 hypothetical protein BJF83_16295 [Nocardiopsis sp. CNR-923]
MRHDPLRAAEHEFLRLELDTDDLLRELAPFTDARPDTLLELRELLLSGSLARQVRDSVWRTVIESARVREEWMVAAIGLAMPALRACAARMCVGLDARAAEDVQEEMLAGFIAAVHEVDTSWCRLPWVLRCRASRWGLRARKEALAVPTAVAEPLANGPVPTGNPDLVLEDAVRQGVISKADADLIGRTRLDRVPLTDVARERGTAYWQLAKRRSRAERRLTDAVRSGLVTARLSALSAA